MTKNVLKCCNLSARTKFRDCSILDNTTKKKKKSPFFHENDVTRKKLQTSKSKLETTRTSHSPLAQLARFSAPQFFGNCTNKTNSTDRRW